MMILDIIFDSIRYTFSNPKNIIRLGICEVLSVFIIPIFFVSGYQYKIIKESLNFMIYDKIEMAELNGFKNLFVDGLKLYFSKLIYLIIPIMGFILLKLGFIENWAYIIVLLVFALLYCYCYIAIANMVKYDSFKKAFAIKEIHNIIRDKIGLTLLFGVFLLYAFIYYAFGVILDEVMIHLNVLLNFNFIVFSSVSLFRFIMLFLTGLLIQPVMHILAARIAGLIYVGVDE